MTSETLAGLHSAYSQIAITFVEWLEMFDQFSVIAYPLLNMEHIQLYHIPPLALAIIYTFCALESFNYDDILLINFADIKNTSSPSAVSYL
jgi:hypothetical protein